MARQLIAADETDFGSVVGAERFDLPYAIVGVHTTATVTAAALYAGR